MSANIIYVLKLEQNKYYVGKTSRSVEERFEEHKSGKSGSSRWTKRYVPLEILECYEEHTKYDENSATKKYMELYGIENVRGGSYCELNLSEGIITKLQEEMDNINITCFNCGGTDHSGYTCKSGQQKFKRRCCGRCGRPGHTRGKCYAKNHIDGTEL